MISVKPRKSKKKIQESFEKAKISPYWKVETYRDFEFAKDLMMQFQSDQLQIPVIRPEYLESTVKGAAMLAGIGAGLFTKEDLSKLNFTPKIFSPKMKVVDADKLYFEWGVAVEKIS